MISSTFWQHLVLNSLSGLLVVASLTTALLPGRNARAGEERFVQDRFAIGFWVDPPADEKMDQRYERIADAHFTIVLGGFGAREPEEIRRQVKLCAKNGLRAIVPSDEAVMDEFADEPAVWGYSLVDEPEAGAFPALGERVAELRRRQPGKLAFINLLPNYASPEQLGTETYDEHVRRAVEQMDVDVLCMDHYPTFKPGGDTRESYCRNLAVLRKHALQAGVPYWNFFNIMPYGPMTDPTAGQVRWQVYTSLAYGARGVLYFCYYTPKGGEFPKGGAIIGRDDRPTRHYGQARRLNRRIKNLGPTLMELTSTDVLRIEPGDEPTKVLAGSPIRDIRHANVDPPPSYLVGTFEHSDGRRAVMINNYRFAYTAWPTVVFDADPSEVVEVDQTTGEEHPVVDDSPAMEGIQVSLDAGQGRLFLLP